MKGAGKENRFMAEITQEEKISRWKKGKSKADKNDTDQWGKTKYREKIMIPFFVPL